MTDEPQAQQTPEFIFRQEVLRRIDLLNERAFTLKLSLMREMRETQNLSATGFVHDAQRRFHEVECPLMSEQSQLHRELAALESLIA
jgi:hypothetical protein